MKINDSITPVITVEDIQQLSSLTEKLAVGLEQNVMTTKTDKEENE